MVSEPADDEPGNTRTALAEAIEKVARGDRDALRTVVDRTSAKLMGICFRILKDRDEAEDVLQEVYVSVWMRAGTFDASRASPITWLAIVARNRAIDRFRSRSARAAPAPLEDAQQIADDRADGFEQAAEREEASRIHHCLSTLDGPAREMIRAAFFDGLSYPQLAARAAVPLGTMKSWIRRGLQRLRSCLEE